MYYFSDAPKLYFRAMVQADECLEDKPIYFDKIGKKWMSEKLHCQKYFQENPYWAHNEAIRYKTEKYMTSYCF